MTSSIREILNGKFNFPVYSSIVDHYIPSRYYDRTNTNSGSNNTVNTFKLKQHLNPDKNFPKKLSVRLAHYETFYYDEDDDKMKLYNSDGEDIEDTIKELEQSEFNWKKSSEYGISPKIYFYDYVIVNNSKGLYLAIISEGYDTNLQEYYNNENNENNQGFFNKYGGELTNNDINIANQLNALFNTMHNKLKIICFDIKPANCVINLHTNEVKLIDWDGDWCKNYERILSGRGDTSQNPNISILSKIIMANQFYNDLGSGCSWNIFSDYFLNNLYGEYGMGDQLAEREAALEYLFCKLKDSEYMRMARHYFGFDDSVKCEYIFKKLFKRCRKLKPPIPHHYGRKKKKRSNINNKKKTTQKNKKRSQRKKSKKTKTTRCRKM
jgi:hypothetical protein